jgi:hypothetical protein
VRRNEMGMFSEIHHSNSARDLKEVLLEAQKIPADEGYEVKKFLGIHIYPLYLAHKGEAWEEPDEEVDHKLWEMVGRLEMPKEATKRFSDYDFPKLVSEADNLTDKVRWAVCAWAFVLPENLKDDVPIEDCCLHKGGFPALSKIGMLVGLEPEYPDLKIRVTEADCQSLLTVQDFVQYLEERI